jgi:hypothetical protein
MIDWQGTPFAASVLAVAGKGRYKIRYDGYDASWDEIVGPNRIKGPAPAAVAGEATSAVEEPERPFLLRGHPLPPLLSALFDADTKVKWGLGALDLELSRSADRMIDSIGGRSGEVAPFAHDKGHHYFGYWLYDGRTPADAPIVFVDDTGLQASVIAESLEDYLSIVLCLRDAFAASSAPLYFDSVNAARGLPVPVGQPMIIGNHKKLVAAAPSPEVALTVLFDAKNEEERKARDQEEQRTRDEDVDRLGAFLADHGVAKTREPYELVKRARERHPQFVLHAEE